MRDEQIGDALTSRALQPTGEEGISDANHSTHWSILSSELSKQELRSVLRRNFDKESGVKPPFDNDSSALSDSSGENSKLADESERRLDKSEAEDKPEDFEYVGLKIRKLSSEEYLKNIAAELIKDSSEKEKFMEDLKKLTDRAKEDELPQEKLDAALEELANTMAGKRLELSTRSAVPENLRVQMVQRLLADLAAPDKLQRERQESREAFEYRKLDYRFKPDVIAKQIADQVLGTVPAKTPSTGKSI